MNPTIMLDSTDFRILKYLLDDARIPYAEIARQCGLAGSTVQTRIKNMQDNHIIMGMRALVSPQHLNLQVCAFVNIKITQPNMLESVVDALKNMPEVVECHAIIGQFSLLLKIYCRDNAHLMGIVVDNIFKIPGIADTSSYISLKQFIDHPMPVLIEEDA